MSNKKINLIVWSVATALLSVVFGFVFHNVLAYLLPMAICAGVMVGVEFFKSKTQPSFTWNNTFNYGLAIFITAVISALLLVIAGIIV